MIERRSFLIGAGSILTSAYVAQANWFLRNQNAVPPLVDPKETTNKLFFVDQGIGKFELRLDSVSDNFPKLTYREALKEYFYKDIPQNGETLLSEFREIYEWYGIRPKKLDTIADPMFYVDQWGHWKVLTPKPTIIYAIWILPEKARGQVHYWETCISGWERSLAVII